MSDDRIDAVRRFNRFYTRRIGVLRRRVYDSPWSLTEARVLYELAHAASGPTAAELQRALDLDAGYLSRILRGFEARGYVRRRRSPKDARRFHLALTAAGRRAFRPLDRASQAQAGALLAKLAPDAQQQLVDGLATIETLLADAPAGRGAFRLRPHRPGDVGWVIERHGALYAGEHGWDATFEALVAEIAAKFLRNFDRRRERCWIAERDGRRVGSVFLVQRSRGTAQLRLLLVEPSARGLGIGRALIAECVTFARRAGYRAIMLWTNAGLDAARHLYEDAGFKLVREEPHRSFGKDLIGQTFELAL